MKPAAILTILFIITLQIITQAQNLFPYRKGKKWGFCDSQKNIIIPVQYDRTYAFNKYNLALVSKGDLYGFIDKTGKTVIPLKYDNLYDFDTIYTIGTLNGQDGIIDTADNTIVPFIYDDIKFNRTNLAVYKLMYRKWALAKWNSDALTPYVYEQIRLFDNETVVAVQVEGYNWGFLDSAGKTITEPIYNATYVPFTEGLCAVALDHKWGFINTAGKVVIDYQYNFIGSFQKEGAWVQKDTKWGLIDSTGKFIIPMQYDEVYSFSEGLAEVKKNGKSGFIDKTGNVVIPLKYKIASRFSEGLALVCTDYDSCGYINTKGEKVIDFKYSFESKQFNEGFAQVTIGKNEGYINAKGEVIVPVKYRGAYFDAKVENGIGQLKLPSPDDITDFDKEGFYFDRKGTLFFTK